MEELLKKIYVCPNGFFQYNIESFEELKDKFFYDFFGAYNGISFQNYKEYFKLANEYLLERRISKEINIYPCKPNRFDCNYRTKKEGIIHFDWDNCKVYSHQVESIIPTGLAILRQEHVFDYYKKLKDTDKLLKKEQQFKIEIVKINENEYYIKDGNHRVLTAMTYNIKDINCILYTI